MKQSTSSATISHHGAKVATMFPNEASTFKKAKPMDNSKLLLDAVKSGKEMLVQVLISRGVSVTSSDQFGGHPLYYAARYNYENILKMLLKKRRNLIDRPTKMLRTPLQIAAFYGHENIVNILIKSKADVTLVDTLGMSALHWAAENNHARIVRILLEAGSNRSLMNKFGKTALCLAAAKNHFEACEVLQDLDKLSGMKYLNNDLAAGKGEHVDASQFAQHKLQENETIKLFEQHGIKLLPVDDSTIIGDALQRGKMAVLTEAGKLALKKTESEFLRSISNMSNTASNAFTQMSPPKKMKVDDTSSTSKQPAEREKPSKQEENETSSETHKPNVIEIDAKKLSDLIARKKLVISRHSRTSTASVDQKQTIEKAPTPDVRVNCPGPKLSSDEITQLQLQNQTTLIKDMKRQLDVSMRLTNYYKNKCEMKEREAELYKSQLVNLSTVLTNSGFQIVNIES